MPPSCITINHRKCVYNHSGIRKIDWRSLSCVSFRIERGAAAIGAYERFQFYDEAKTCYCILQTGETAIYANVILQKGVVK